MPIRIASLTHRIAKNGAMLHQAKMDRVHSLGADHEPSEAEQALAEERRLLKEERAKRQAQAQQPRAKAVDKLVRTHHPQAKEKPKEKRSPRRPRLARPTGPRVPRSTLRRRRPCRPRVERRRSRRRPEKALRHRAERGRALPSTGGVRIALLRCRAGPEPPRARQAALRRAQGKRHRILQEAASVTRARQT